MDKLDKELQRLSKIDPEKDFIEMSKTRLMHRIAKEQPDAWFRTFLNSNRLSDPSKSFIAQARLRLMAQINQLPQPVKLPLKGLAYFLNFLKKAVASTLVMMIAVTAVLFQLEGNTVVEASNDSYLEVLSGPVSLKEGDVETLENAPTQKEIEAGDIIQLQEGAQAVIHFFDGTELRLDGNTTLSLNQLDFSPAVEDQAIIEVDLEKGRVWVQTLNVDDGYAGFTMLTEEGVINALNAAFSVQTFDNSSTEVAVFNGALNVSTFSPATGELAQKVRLTPDKIAVLNLDDQNQTLIAQNTIPPEFKDSEWARNNLEKDKTHLAELSKMSLERLTLMAGTLPGDMLYSIKQAKENLRLAWSDDADLSVKIDIANNRLNEAIVLFERGEIETAQKSLESYQQLAREILAANKTQDSKTLITQLVAPHQKVLFTKPADKNTLVVKEALQQTAEILAQNPLDLENIRLKNSVASLQDIRTLIDQGQVDLAKEKLSKYKVNEVSVAMLEGVENPEEKREVFQQILDLKQEEKDLLALVSENKDVLQEDEELMAMVETTARQVEADADRVQSAALTALPDLTISAEPTEEVIDSNPTPEVVTPVVSEAEKLAARINIYTNSDGQMNQIQRLLGDMLEDTSKIDFLIEVNQYLSGRAKNYLGTRILQLQNKLKEEQTPETVEPTSPTTETTPEITDPLSSPTTEEPTTVPSTDPSTIESDSEPLGQIRTFTN